MMITAPKPYTCYEQNLIKKHSSNVSFNNPVAFGKLTAPAVEGGSLPSNSEGIPQIEFIDNELSHFQEPALTALRAMKKHAPKTLGRFSHWQIDITSSIGDKPPLIIYSKNTIIRIALMRDASLPDAIAHALAVAINLGHVSDITTYKPNYTGFGRLLTVLLPPKLASNAPEFQAIADSLGEKGSKKRAVLFQTELQKILLGQSEETDVQNYIRRLLD